MKTHMTKIIVALAILAVFPAYAGKEAGNGGGGIRRSGRLLTLGTAGVRLHLEPLSAEEIPGFSELNKGILKLALSEHDSSSLTKAAWPSSQRNYFRVTESEMDPKTLAELKKIYRDLLGSQVNPNEIEIFAITNPKTKETYLLPSFFALDNKASQAAILFHEGTWIANPKAKYDQVVDAEMSFEKFLKGDMEKFSSQLYHRIGTALGRPYLALTAAMQYDSSRRHTNPGLDEYSEYRIGSLFGTDALLSWDDQKEFRTLAEGHLKDISQSDYPNIVTYSELYEYADSLAIVRLDNKIYSGQGSSFNRWLVDHGVMIPIAMDVDNDMQGCQTIVARIVADYDLPILKYGTNRELPGEIFLIGKKKCVSN